jgi:hypothetical protein
MRLMRIAALLLTVLAVGVTAQSTPTGKWRTVIVAGKQHKTFGEVFLDLKADGEKLTGTATLGDMKWPGSATVQDGKIEGNRFSFKWTGTVESCGGSPFSCGVPRLTFKGTVDGDQMTVSVDGDWQMELKGERLPLR